MNRINKWTYFYPLLLIIFTFICVLLVLPEGALFGSEGDWFSQHLAVAEQFRTIFYETGRILPDISPAGAGSNIYDFSYYGLLRPDVLISFLLPDVSMGWILSGYAILELMAGSVLCYYWLNRHLSIPFFGFIGGMLYSCAACFYQAHHQIMFVNYMPFLLLALRGADRLLEKEKHGLLVVSLVLVYLHSYYFAPAVLAAVGLWFLFRLYSEKEITGEKGKIAYWLRFAFSIVISIGISAILLLPTGLDLLSTSKDAGTPAAPAELFSVNFSMESLLYHPYGCGLTILCLYTLLLSIRRKSTRILALTLLVCLTWNICPYILSGFLYIRYKVLIPLVPLLLLLCTRTLELLFTGKERHSLFCGLLCLIPVYFFELPQAALADVVLTALIFTVIALAKKLWGSRHPEAVIPGRAENTSSPANRKPLPFYLLFCLVPAAVSVTVGQNDQFISASDNRHAVFSQEELETLELNRNYRFDCLTEPYANVNVLPLRDMGSTTMYSSVTDSNYADFYYNIMKNPIRVRNRVALMTDANPFFSYLMGIRYIQTWDSHIPWGYEPIARKGHTVIAENSRVLPVAYTSISCMAQEEFDRLEFPWTLEALTRYTIADSSRTENSGSLQGSVTVETFQKTSRITPVSLEDLTVERLSDMFEASAASWQQQDDDTVLSLSLKQETKITLPLREPLKDKILICSFSVKSPKNREVTLEINGIRNRLSGKNAPYPNQNHTFTWLISSSQTLDALDITLSSGTYLLSDLQFWIMDTEDWGKPDAVPVSSEKTSGHTLFRGTVSCEKDGFFVTSFPFRKGYTVRADGKEISPRSVNQGFVGFPLTAGTHEISISYVPPGKTAAAVISFLSLLLFAAGILPENIYKKRGVMMKKYFNLKNHRLLTASASKHSLSEMFSYLLTGGATTLINYGVYLTLLHFKADYLAANTIAWIFAVSFAYVANRRFVFRSENQIGKELVSFVSLRFLTLLTENLLLILFIQRCQIHPVLSKLAVSFVTVAANYVICKCQIFRKPAGYLNTRPLPEKGEEIHE